MLKMLWGRLIKYRKIVGHLVKNKITFDKLEQDLKKKFFFFFY